LFERVSKADDEDENKKEKLGGVRSDRETLTTQQKRILRKLTKTPCHYAYGENEFKDFKIELEKYLRVCDGNQRYRINTIISLLHGPALKWAECSREQYKMRNNEEIGKNELIDGLERHFCEKRSTVTLLRALDNVKMIGDLEEYEKRFIDLTYNRDLGEEEFIYYFKRNLSY
jgi:hypothetical protein